MIKHGIPFHNFAPIQPMQSICNWLLLIINICHLSTVEEKRRLINLRKANLEENGETLDDESERNDRESDLDRFVRLLEDNEEMETIIEDDEPVKRTHSKGIIINNNNNNSNNNNNNNYYYYYYYYA